MTDDLHDLLADLLSDEPPFHTGVDSIVLRSRRRHRRRRMSAIGVASVVPLVVLVVAVALGGQALRSTPTTDFPGVRVSAPSRWPEAPRTTPPTGSVTQRRTVDASSPTAPSAPSAPVPDTATELLADPGFEAAASSWAVFGPSTTLTPSATARTGAGALSVATTAAGAVPAGATNTPLQLGTVQGRGYTASCWVRSASRIGAYVQLQEYTRDWQKISNAVKSPRAALDDPATWYQVTVSYVAAQSGNLLPLTVMSLDLTPGGPPLLVDDCSLTVSPTGTG